MCGTVNVRLLNACEKNANFVAHREMRTKLKWKKEISLKCFEGMKKVFMIETNSACAPEDKTKFITLTGTGASFALE